MANPSTPATPSRLSKITGSTPEICSHFALSDEGRTILQPDLPAEAFVDRLCAAGLWIDAVRFLAHALPKREAVWWGCLAARATLGETPHDAARGAVDAAEAWVYRPNEDNRRAAMAAATAAGNDSPAGWAARGAFWSGGSLAPPEGPVVPPAETLTGAAVAGAVCLAAVQREPEHAPDKYRLFVAQGLDIAGGGTGRSKSG
jgi:hypothetical protein